MGRVHSTVDNLKTTSSVGNPLETQHSLPGSVWLGWTWTGKLIFTVQETRCGMWREPGLGLWGQENHSKKQQWLHRELRTL